MNLILTSPAPLSIQMGQVGFPRVQVWSQGPGRTCSVGRYIPVGMDADEPSLAELRGGRDPSRRHRIRSNKVELTSSKNSRKTTDFVINLFSLKVERTKKRASCMERLLRLPQTGISHGFWNVRPHVPLLRAIAVHKPCRTPRTPTSLRDPRGKCGPHSLGLSIFPTPRQDPIQCTRPAVAIAFASACQVLQVSLRAGRGRSG